MISEIGQGVSSLDRGKVTLSKYFFCESSVFKLTFFLTKLTRKVDFFDYSGNSDIPQGFAWHNGKSYYRRNIQTISRALPRL